MHDKFWSPLIAGILLMAIGASAKSIVDVHVLETKIETFKSLLTEVRQDVKDIKDLVRR